MACSQLLTGIKNDCSRSIGGLATVFIANYDDVKSVTDKDGKIVKIEMNDDKKFFKFEFRRNTASMTSTLNVDATNGNSVSTDVELSFIRQETAKRLAVSALSVGEVAMIVKDANGLYWYLGKDLAVTASAGGAESGTAYTDGNRYTITLQDNSIDYPYEVKVEAETSGDSEYVNLSEIVE